MGLFKEVRLLLARGDSDHFQLLEGLLSSLLIMAWMVEARDPYTGGHLWRVSRFARLLAAKSGLSENDVERISVGGFLHDLGKVGVPDHILNKKARLTEEEYEVIKTHPEVGWRMLAGHPLAQLAEAAVRAHHEIPDGNGYPRGLRQEEIPVDARIVGICDAFDAMTSTRPYRRGLEINSALSIIEDNLGRQFDMEYGRYFLDLGRAGTLDHIVGHSDEGIPLRECMVCGPTLVLKYDQKDSEYVYCRSCSAEYKTVLQDGVLITQPTGRMGSAQDLEPEADLALIKRLVNESAPTLLT